MRNRTPGTKWQGPDLPARFGLSRLYLVLKCFLSAVSRQLELALLVFETKELLEDETLKDLSARLVGSHGNAQLNV